MTTTAPPGASGLRTSASVGSICSIEQVLDDLDEEDDVERRIGELLGPGHDAAEERVAGEALAAGARRLLRELEPLRGDSTVEQVREQVAAAAPVVEDPLAPQADVALDLLDDPAARVRAEVPDPAGPALAVEVPRRRDLLRRPDDVVSVGHASHYRPQPPSRYTASALLSWSSRARGGGRCDRSRTT